jgi:chromosome segregation ATPase
MIMKKAIIPLIVIFILSPIVHGQTLIYSWRDSAGKVHIVDELNKVPVQYRDNMNIYRLSSRKGAKKPRSKAPSEPVTKVKEVEEEIVKGGAIEREMEEVRGTINDVRDRLEALTQERETKRIRMIRQRGRGKSVVRERGELEEIAQEIETLTDQLEERMEALRSLEEEQSVKGGE